MKIKNTQCVIPFLSLILVVSCAMLIGCIPAEPKPTPPTAPTISTHKDSGFHFMRTLITAQELYSAKVGGGGTTKFAPSLKELEGFVSDVMAPPFTQEKLNKIGGYEIDVEPIRDATGNVVDYKIVGKPASGYKGPVIWMFKDGVCHASDDVEKEITYPK